MADLVDRISGESGDERPKINLHRFMGVQRLYALGELTGAQIVAEFDLQGDEATQAAQLKTQIDAQVGVQDKALYILRVESVFMCLEDKDDTFYHDAGVVDKAAVYAALLFT